MAYANPSAGKRRADIAEVAVANVAAANASDLASAQALANELKTKLNALLVECRKAGVIAP